MDPEEESTKMTSRTDVMRWHSGPDRTMTPDKIAEKVMGWLRAHHLRRVAEGNAGSDGTYRLRMRLANGSFAYRFVFDTADRDQFAFAAVAGLDHEDMEDEAIVEGIVGDSDDPVLRFLANELKSTRKHEREMAAERRVERQELMGILTSRETAYLANITKVVDVLSVGVDMMKGAAKTTEKLAEIDAEKEIVAAESAATSQRWSDALEGLKAFAGVAEAALKIQLKRTKPDATPTASASTQKPNAEQATASATPAMPVPSSTSAIPDPTPDATPDATPDPVQDPTHEPTEMPPSVKPEHLPAVLEFFRKLPASVKTKVAKALTDETTDGNSIVVDLQSEATVIDAILRLSEAVFQNTKKMMAVAAALGPERTEQAVTLMETALV